MTSNAKKTEAQDEVAEVIKVPDELVALARTQLEAVPGSAEYQTANQMLIMSAPAPWMVDEALAIALEALDKEAVKAGKPQWVEPTPALLPEQEAYLTEVEERRKREAAIASYVPPKREPRKRIIPEATEFQGSAVPAGVSGSSSGSAPQAEGKPDGSGSVAGVGKG